MAENKTQPTRKSPEEFVSSVEHPTRKRDGETLLSLMEDVTGEEPVMWGSSIVGFGRYHYVYESGREGDWMRIGFSPRKASLSLYGLLSAPESDELLERLGKHKTGKGCLYINKLDDVDMDVLRELIAAAWRHGEGR